MRISLVEEETVTGLPYFALLAQNMYTSFHEWNADILARS
jgi:hypothetical protein